jgi:hypothetical protein
VSKRLGGKLPQDAQRELAERSATFYVHPEYKLPSDNTPVSAVADGLAPGASIWRWSGEESLHPFWAIQRMSADDMKKNNNKGDAKYRFNVSLKNKQYSVVTVGDLLGRSVAVTATVSVPVITNETKLAAGEELFLEIAQKAAPPKRKDTSWKDEVASAAKAKAKAKVANAAAKPKAGEAAGKPKASMTLDSEV